MATKLIKKISKGTRFNQIYLQKNEGVDFEPGKAVLITPVAELITEEQTIFEHNVKLSSLKREIARKIFKIIGEACSYKNIIITGSFLNEGFDFEDIDIVIINQKGMDEERLKSNIMRTLGINPHLILIDSASFNRGIQRDPLFQLMVDRYVSAKRTILRKDKEINYRILDAYLIKNKNLIDGFDLLNIRQRKKLLRDFISIKLFVDGNELTISNLKSETIRLFGKDVIENLFYYGDTAMKHRFLSKLKKEYNQLEKKILENAAKQA